MRFKADHSKKDIRQAFANDGYQVIREQIYKGNRGYLAESNTVTNYDTGKKKQVMYVEGDAFTMGYLIGRLAPEQIKRMADDFVDNMIPAFIHPKAEPDQQRFLKDLLGFIVRVYTRFIYALPWNWSHIPWRYRREMRGLVKGFRDSKIKGKVRYGEIFALNAGIDSLLSLIYKGFGLLFRFIMFIKELFRPNRKEIPEHKRLYKDLKQHLKQQDQSLFRIPVGCNALYLGPDMTEDEHSRFGRDFMFPTAGVFQDTACMIIYNPRYIRGHGHALVSVTAPGFVGSITTLNSRGVGMGVNMVSSVLSSPLRPGFNSLMMVRHVGHEADDAAEGVETIVKSPRGVTWLYPLGDRGGRAVVCETGKKKRRIRSWVYPPGWVRDVIPEKPYNPSISGVYTRWNDYEPEQDFLALNPDLYKAWSDFSCKDLPYPQAAFDDVEGMINPDWHTANMPESFYFAPPRETLPGVLIVSNMYLVPEMRMTAMAPWTNFVTGSHLDDFQWRYDELNRRTLQAAGYRDGHVTQKIDVSTARNLIDFLSPVVGWNPDYYKDAPRSDDGKEPRIEGCVSLLDLEDLTIISHYGYYCDEWLSLNLKDYLDEE